MSMWEQGSRDGIQGSSGRAGRERDENYLIVLASLCMGCAVSCFLFKIGRRIMIIKMLGNSGEWGIAFAGMNGEEC
jgi:hypothetical protein